MTQQIRLVQRNFTTELKSAKGEGTYVTIPSKLIDFQDRLNDICADGYRLFSIIDQLVNNVNCPIFVLIRDGEIP